MCINTQKTSKEIFEVLQKRRLYENNPVGYFELFDKNKKIYSNDNLIVGAGRQYAAQKVVSSLLTESTLSLTELPSGCDNLRNYELTHYAFGGGGAVLTDSIDRYQLINPSVCDLSLNRPISFNVNSYLDDPGQIDEGDSLHLSSKSVKPIRSGNNSFEYSLKEYPIDAPTCSYFTQFQLTLFKEEGEFGSLDAGESVQVSEAGLYITYNSIALLFAKICFPPKFMEKEAQYGIEWYILC